MALDTYALTTVAAFRAYTGLEVATVDDLQVENLLNAAQNAVEGHCRRLFAVREYKEFYDGLGDPYLLLRQRPLVEVTRATMSRASALQITHAAANASLATANVSEDGRTLILLQRISGAWTTDTIDLTLPANLTLTLLAPAITLLAGWTASVAIAAYAPFPSTDLWPLAASPCLNASLTLAIAGGPDDGFSIDWEASELRRACGWPKGYRNVLVEYTAGYATIPYDLAQVCIEVAAKLYRLGERDTTLKSERLGPYAWTAAEGAGAALLDVGVMLRLVPFKETMV